MIATELILAPHTVDLWDVALPVDASDAGAFSAILSEEERARAAQYHLARDRERFALRRGLLRHLLARYSGISPERIVLGSHPCGKPYLSISGHEFRAISFSLSDSSDRVVYAFAANMRVGVDVERIRGNVDFGSLARRFFTPEEHSALRHLAEREQPDAFFALWTRKEALTKAEGVGLSAGLNRFDIPLTPVLPDRGTQVRAWHDRDEQWRLYDLDLAPGFRGALAVDCSVREIRHQAWNW